MTEVFETNLGLESVIMMEADAFLDNTKSYYKNTEEFGPHHSNSGYQIFFYDNNDATAFARGVIIVKSTPGGDYAAVGAWPKTCVICQFQTLRDNHSLW